MSGILCFHCCHTFTTQSLSLPTSYNKDVFETRGHFCSWECMKAFVVYSKDDVKFNKFSLITLMRSSMNLFTTLICAPHREMLIAFGGKMSIEEFRSSNDIYTYLPGPMIKLNPLIEKNTNISCVSREDASKMFVNMDNDNELVLKKKKPLNALERAMGLVKEN